MKEKYVEHKLGKCPNISLMVRRVEASVWKTMGFKDHHYLTQELNPSAKCFLFEWDGEPIAFVGILCSPGKARPNAKSISRIVILPDFQGLGVCRKIMDFCGGIIANQGWELYIKTAHDKMGAMLSKNKNWKPTPHNGKERHDYNNEYNKTCKYKHRLKRRSYCYAYVGDKIQGYEDMLLPIETIREKRYNRYQLNFFDQLFSDENITK